MPVAPYTDNASYLDDEILRYLSCRATRISYQQQLRDNRLTRRSQTENAEAAEKRIRELLDEEKAIRSDIDSRLEATRLGSTVIGLDQLTTGLNADARMVLLALAACALGLGERALGALGTHYFTSLNAQDLSTLLESNSVSQQLDLRQLLAELEARELIRRDRLCGDQIPEDLWGTGVSLTNRSFAEIIGETWEAPSTDEPTMN